MKVEVTEICISGCMTVKIASYIDPFNYTNIKRTNL